MTTGPFEPVGSDFVWHGALTIIGVAVLAASAPVWLPLYVVGRASHRWFWPIEAPDPSEAEVWW